MAFKFIVKDEDLPKPTVLSTIHLISFILLIPIFSISHNEDPNAIVPIVVLEFIQLIYLGIFYKKIVWERYANLKLSIVTYSFIATNISLGILSILDWKFGPFLSLIQIIITLTVVFFATIPITIFCRKINLLDPIKFALSGVKDFSFPFYKYTAIIPMLLILLCVLIKSKIYMAISLSLLVVGMIYTGFGEYFNIKKKDELDRQIKYEASYLAMNLLPAIFSPLFFIETFWKVQVPWFYVMILFFIIHGLVQTIINRKYE